MFGAFFHTEFKRIWKDGTAQAKCARIKHGANPEKTRRQPEVDAKEVIPDVARTSNACSVDHMCTQREKRKAAVRTYDATPRSTSR